MIEITKRIAEISVRAPVSLVRYRIKIARDGTKALRGIQHSHHHQPAKGHAGRSAIERRSSRDSRALNHFEISHPHLGDSQMKRSAHFRTIFSPQTLDKLAAHSYMRLLRIQACCVYPNREKSKPSDSHRGYYVLHIRD
jgi:hypothetical protein